MSKTVQDRAIVRPTVEYFFKYLTFAAQLAQLLAWPENSGRFTL